MLYLTYNDQPSGIYKSQVIDVVRYLNSLQPSEKVKLVALISIRGFFKSRKKVKKDLSSSIVIPMFPGAGLWKLNYLTLLFLFFFSKHKSIMARGPFATCLAISLKNAGLFKKVIFDARGAYTAELTEYTVIENKKIVAQIKDIERKALLGSDYRLAVSEALVNYWRSSFNYNQQEHIVVPCTLSENFIFPFPGELELFEYKKKLGFVEDDIVIVYSGSSAGWQSFQLIRHLLLDLLHANSKLKLLMLVNKTGEMDELVKTHKGKIKTAWVEPQEVKKYLLAADYGIMYREATVTNKVASPVKFGEYLSCGLNVIVSEELGDFTEFVRRNSCGMIYKKGLVHLDNVSYESKLKNHQLANKNLIKEVFKSEYLKLFR